MPVHLPQTGDLHGCLKQRGGGRASQHTVRHALWALGGVAAVAQPAARCHGATVPRRHGAMVAPARRTCMCVCDGLEQGHPGGGKRQGGPRYPDGQGCHQHLRPRRRVGEDEQVPQAAPPRTSVPS